MANKYNKNLIRNADTRARREWIESALASVRSHLEVSTFQASTLESQGHEQQCPECHEASNPPQTADKPGLYLAWSDGVRRSGT